MQDAVDHREDVGPVGLENLPVSVLDQEMLVRAKAGHVGHAGEQTPVQPLVAPRPPGMVTGRRATVSGAGPAGITSTVICSGPPTGRAAPAAARRTPARRSARFGATLGGDVAEQLPGAFVQARDVPVEVMTPAGRDAHQRERDHRGPGAQRGRDGRVAEGRPGRQVLRGAWRSAAEISGVAFSRHSRYSSASEDPATIPPPLPSHTRSPPNSKVRIATFSSGRRRDCGSRPPRYRPPAAWPRARE